MKEITVSDIRPFVRFVHKFRAFDGNVLENRMGYDYRIFYILSGCGIFEIGDESFRVEPGLLVLIPSGTEYSIIYESGKQIEALGINFDYSSDFRHISRPIFPIGKYNEEKRLERFSFSDYPELNKFLKLYKMNIIEERLFSILREFEQSFILAEQKLSALLLDVLTDIIRTHISEKNSVRQADSKAEEILSFLRTNYSETITNEELSRRFGYHPNHINYLIKMKTGISIHQYLINYRLSKAAELLRTTDLPVYFVANKVGYQDYVYFLKCFKKHFGVTTSDIRKEK